MIPPSSSFFQHNSPLLINTGSQTKSTIKIHPSSNSKPSTAQITPPPVKPNILNKLDSLLNKIIIPPPLPSLDPQRSLSNDFFPVNELPPTECHVIQGSLPPSLNGAYIRNGPNPQYLPSGPYHLFDGDGMLHSVRISNGKAVYCCRHVKTYKYTVDRDHGFPVIPSVLSSFTGPIAFLTHGFISVARRVAGHYDLANGIGQANTSLVYFGNRLYALHEADLPYAVRLTSDGDIQTLNRHDFNGKLLHCMTAHPKTDPLTGEMFAFRYSPMPPFVTYFYFDSDGNKQPDVPIHSFSRPLLLHDFAITQNYALFVDIQLEWDFLGMILHGRSLLRTDSTKVSRIGIIPRYAKDTSAMRWFEILGFNNLHCVNAWEEDDGNTIILVAPNVLSIEHWWERMELSNYLMEKVKIDLVTGLVSRSPISARNLDFGTINQGYLGQTSRYVYAGIFDPLPRMTGVVKLDLSKGEKQECTVAIRSFGSDCYGGESYFVARDPDDPTAEEDDGYLVAYVYDHKMRESRFLVMNAKSPDLDIVAAVKLPQRVPAGFHGLFLRESELMKQ